MVASNGGALCFAAMALLCPQEATADEWQVIGARYQGLGGAGVAMAFDAEAAEWNPGTLAFSSERTEEVALRGSLSAAAEGGFLEHAGDVVDFVEETDVDRSIDRLRAGGTLSDAELRDAAVFFLEEAPGLLDDDQGAQARADAGLLLRRGRLVLTSRAFGFVGAGPQIDLRSFALGASSGFDVRQLVGSGGDRSAEFRNPSSQPLADALVQTAGQGVTPEQAEELVFQVEQAGIDTGSAKAQGLLLGLAQSPGASAPPSGFVVRGLYVKQVGVAYALPVIPDKLGVGAHVKYMHGTTVREFVGVDASGDTERSGRSPRRRSRELGLDLGITYVPSEWLRLGLAARNVNGPEFKTVGSQAPIRLRPQVRAGVALRLSPRVNVAADIDVTRNELVAIDGFASRVFSTGVEFRTRFRRFTVDLRGGAQRNLSSGPDDDLTLTLGFGLHVRASRFDLAFAYGLGGERVERVGLKLPRRAELGGGLRWVREF